MFTSLIGYTPFLTYLPAVNAGKVNVTALCCSHSLQYLTAVLSAVTCVAGLSAVLSAVLSAGLLQHLTAVLSAALCAVLAAATLTAAPYCSTLLQLVTAARYSSYLLQTDCEEWLLVGNEYRSERVEQFWKLKSQVATRMSLHARQDRFKGSPK